MSDHILICDDEIELREMLAEYLGKRGFRTSLAANADDLRANLSREKPDLILLDINMPGEDGLSVLRSLQGPDAQTRGNLAAALMQVRRVDEAIPHLLEAVRIDPYHPTAYEHLVDVMIYKGRLEEAAQYLDAAERIAPDLPEVHRAFEQKRRQFGLRPRAPETQPNSEGTPH